MTTYVGIDLAWSARNRTGLAVVDGDGRLVTSGHAKTDVEIDAWLAENAPAPRTVGIDAPLIVPNETGQRVAEREIGRAYGRFGAGAYPSNRTNPLFDPPRGKQLAERHNWPIDPLDRSATTQCIEVYPHPALVGLFLLPQRILYKKGSNRQPGFVELARCLESVPELALDTSVRWREIRDTIASPGPGDLTRIEDEIDAVLCAHLAWLWHRRPDSLVVYGTFEEGYIVAPPPPDHASEPVSRVRVSPRVRATKPTGVSLDVWGTPPGAFATARGTRWFDAVRAATRGQKVFRPGERLGVTVDFVLPPRRDSGDEWDLDNLLKPTIDALVDVLGTRPVTSVGPQADDERVDAIMATKRRADSEESVGARIDLWAIADRD